MSDTDLLNTVVFQTIARLNAGSTVSQNQLHDAARKGSYEYTKGRGMTDDDKYALSLNVQAAIKADWTAYITVIG